MAKKKEAAKKVEAKESKPKAAEEKKTVKPSSKEEEYTSSTDRATEVFGSRKEVVLKIDDIIINGKAMKRVVAGTGVTYIVTERELQEGLKQK